MIYPYRQHIKRLLVGLWLALLTLVPSFAPTIVQAQASDQEWLLNQINSLRANLGLHAYVWNNQLAAAAQQQSEYMAATGHISHTQSNGSTPSSRAAAKGYGGSWVSENIYGGGLAQAVDAWNFWLNSPAHYAGIAHQRNNEIGIGVASSDRGQFFTLVFGYQTNLNAPSAQSNNDAVSGDTGSQDAAPPPAQVRPPTRLPPTRTPQPTVPSQTPTITWTPTATWTASPTATSPPPTVTPISLAVTDVAMALSPKQVVAVSNPTTQPTELADIPQTRSERLTEPVESPAQDDDADLSHFLPLILLAQAVLLGSGAYFLFFRNNNG